MTNPQVTIGLPVFNGAEYVHIAIASALSQTYSDFELVISDNASTDATSEICEKFAKEDSRVRYVRQPVNVGAGPNFNGLVDLARGQYFKWLAHDDAMAPTFLERCVDALETDESAVLACPRVRFIDRTGKTLQDFISPFRTDVPDRLTRFRDMFRGHRCFEVFGLIRLSDLKLTHRIGNYNHGDGVLLSHLALLGRMADIPEHLFLSRQHEEQSMYRFGITSGSGVDLDGYARWFDPTNGAVPRSFNRQLVEYLWMIRTTPMSARERALCYAVVARWCGVSWRIIAGEWKRTLYYKCGIGVGADRRSTAPARRS